MGLRVNVGETGDEIHVTAEMPGVKEADIDVTLDDDVLRISAEKKAETEKSEEKWHIVERSYGRYERAVQVPGGIDPEKVKAAFRDGVLSVTLPKPPEVETKARKISVSSA
jgi:HSP20 family protein